MKKCHITKKKLISLSGISENDYRKMKASKDVKLLTLWKIARAFSFEPHEMADFIFTKHNQFREY